MAGHGAIAAPLRSTAGVGWFDANRGDGQRYIVEADELLSAFWKLEATLRKTSGQFGSTNSRRFVKNCR